LTSLLKNFRIYWIVGILCHPPKQVASTWYQTRTWYYCIILASPLTTSQVTDTATASTRWCDQGAGYLEAHRTYLPMLADQRRDVAVIPTNNDLLCCFQRLEHVRSVSFIGFLSQHLQQDSPFVMGNSDGLGQCRLQVVMVWHDGYDLGVQRPLKTHDHHRT